MILRNGVAFVFGSLGIFKVRVGFPFPHDLTIEGRSRIAFECPWMPRLRPFGLPGRLIGVDYETFETRFEGELRAWVAWA